MCVNTDYVSFYYIIQGTKNILSLCLSLFVLVLVSVISQYEYAAYDQVVIDFHYGLMVSAWASRFLGKCQRWFDPS